MEGKAHRRRDYSPAGRLSRTERDLSSCSMDFDLMADGGLPDNMIQRLAILRSPGKLRHVCVVGAGIAGLRCAEVLLEQGIKVTVLEGRDRIGGRVCLRRSRW